MNQNYLPVFKWIFVLALLIFFAGCRKSDSIFIAEQNKNYEELKSRFFNTSTIKDPEIKRLAENIKKQDSIFKFLPDFVRKNGLPKWDKVLYKMANASGSPMVQSSSARASNSNNASGADQGIFFIPLQSENSAEIKSYITAYKHNDSLYTYRLYNRDSLNAIKPGSAVSKNNLMNTQAVFGYFEKSINNTDSINVSSPQKATIKNVSISFDNPDLGRAAANARTSFDCEVSLSVTIEYTLEIWTDGYNAWVSINLSVTLEITIDCYGGGGGGCGCGGGSPNAGLGDPSGGVNWWDYGTGWPWNSGGGPYDPNWYWWWTGGGGSGNGASYEKSIFDDYTGDEDNNTQWGYDNTNYTDYDQTTQAWPSISNVIPVSDFVGWGTPGILENCMSYAKAQIEKKGYRISNYGDPGQTIQVYTAANGANLSNAKNGVGYLLSALQRGIPVIVGIENHPGSSNPQTDNTTDHFVVIVGAGTDAKGNYFTFYDNANRDSYRGASPENKLYYNSATGLISGNSQTTYAIDNHLNPYIVTQIRKSK